MKLPLIKKSIQSRSVSTEVLLAVALFVSVLFFRLIPHLANFSPVIVLAFFVGYYFKNSKTILLSLLSSLLLSDLLLGLDSSSFSVYLSYALIYMLGSRLSSNSFNFLGAIVGPLIFFFVTNLSVWAFSGMYSHTAVGAIECLTMAIPFFKMTFVSSILWGGLFSIVGSICFSKLNTERVTTAK